MRRHQWRTFVDIPFHGNYRALSAFLHWVTDLWRRTLRRRSQKDGLTWDRMTKLGADFLPKSGILHPWPEKRFAVKHPR
jgi:RNA-directed DNA polymerase